MRSITYSRPSYWPKPTVRSKTDKFICRPVTRMVLGLKYLTVRPVVRWWQIGVKPLLSKGCDLSVDLSSLKRAITPWGDSPQEQEDDKK